MPAEVETMAFAGATPWHGLGTRLSEEDLYDWQKAAEKAGLAWDVELAPLVTADTQAPVAHRAVRRTTDSRILSVVGPRFTVLQNQDAFRWFQPFLDAREAALHTAGALRQGIRLIPGFITGINLPDTVTTPEQALAWAIETAKQKRKKVILVVSRRVSWTIHEDGRADGPFHATPDGNAMPWMALGRTPFLPTLDRSGNVQTDEGSPQ